MTDQRYELRSEEAGEMMNKLPRAAVLWGNTIILVLLVAGLYLLDRVSLPQYRTIPVVVRRMEPDLNGMYRADLGLRYAADKLNGNSLVLQYSKAEPSQTAAISGRVIAVKKTGPFYCIVTLLLPVSGPPGNGGYLPDLPDSGQVCTAKINTGTRSIFSMIRRQFGALLTRH